ncbi:MAG: hypothetical protein QF411_13840 [Planctomycetota bacterium]|nr:hypothetical protein [Planctomycetota bacterium]
MIHTSTEWRTLPLLCSTFLPHNRGMVRHSVLGGGGGNRTRVPE